MGSKLIRGEDIMKVVDDSLCTGCGTCAGICPSSAIKMIKENSKGIFIPRLDLQGCNRCEICYKVCPGHSIDQVEINKDVFSDNTKKALIGNYLNSYCGFATDHDIRYSSASGGLVTAVLIHALDEGRIDGALVTRMKKDNPLEPEPFIARTKDEIIEASKSKYCPVPANIAISEILEKEGRYAVVGLPCHIHGIRNAERINKKLKERIVLHLSIFCSGVPSFMATEFLLFKRNLRSEEVKKLDYRGEGWPGCMTLCLKNDEKIFLPYPGYRDGKRILFIPTLFISDRCAVCTDWFSEMADISFGDAWLPEIKKYDTIGTSIIISRTNNGEDILAQMLNKGVISLNLLSVDKILESQPGFFYKKKQLVVRLAISRFLDRKVPFNNYCCADNISFQDYLKFIFLYLLRSIASKRTLWRFLDLHHSILCKGNILKNKLGF